MTPPSLLVRPAWRSVSRNGLTLTGWVAYPSTTCRLRSTSSSKPWDPVWGGGGQIYPTKHSTLDGHETPRRGICTAQGLDASKRRSFFLILDACGPWLPLIEFGQRQSSGRSGRRHEGPKTLGVGCHAFRCRWRSMAEWAVHHEGSLDYGCEWHAYYLYRRELASICEYHGARRSAVPIGRDHHIKDQEPAHERYPTYICD
jgi:hypothetical protein